MNDVWCWGFVFDRTTSGTPLKRLSIVDEHTRECLALKMDRGITGEDVIDMLAELFAIRGVPRAIRSDNGPEFVAGAIQSWLAQLDVQAKYVAPGSPWQNGYAESFHSRLRDEFSAREEFESLLAARRLTTAWREDYNHHRPRTPSGSSTRASSRPVMVVEPHNRRPTAAGWSRSCIFGILGMGGGSLVRDYVRSGRRVYRCEDDSGRTAELPYWMFDRAVYCHPMVAGRPSVDVAELRRLQE